MRWILLIAITMLVALVGMPKAVAQFVTFPTLYDDFHGKLIDPDRWAPVRAHGYDLSIGQHGQLIMALQAYGTGPSPQGFINQGMTNSAAATATGIQVTVRVQQAKITGCGSNPPGRARAGLNAPLFRDGPNPADPFDQTGVVVAVNGLRIFAHQHTVGVVFLVVRCVDFNCNTEFDLGRGTFQDLTEPDEEATLGIELDAANNRVIFTKDNETEFVTNVSANQINTDLGPLHFKRVQAIHFLEDCPTQAQGFIQASFENFRITP